MPENVEVKTSLTLDTDAASELRKLQEGFEEVDEASDDAESGIKDFGTQFAATFAAVNLVPFIEQMGDFALATIEVGSAAFDTEQGLAGMMAGMTGASWGIARENAERINAQFNELSIGIGQSKDDIIAGHRALINFLGGTDQAFAAAEKNMKSLTIIANVQGHSVQEMGSQFGKMAAGFVSMESPMFGMLRNTGIFADELKDVNKEWQELTQPERIARLEGAFQDIAENLAEAPMTLSDMVTSIKAIGAESLEVFGKSAMEEFMGSLGDFRGELVTTREQFAQYASELGRDLGQFVSSSIENMRDAFQYLSLHASEIKDAIVQGFQFARDTFSWIIENKEVLAMALGARALGGAGMAGGAARGAAGFAGGALGVIGSGSSTQMQRSSTQFSNATASMARHSGTMARAGAGLTTGIGSLVGAIAAGGPVVWALTAAVGAMAVGAVYAVNQMNEAEEERARAFERSTSRHTELTSKLILTDAEKLERDKADAEARLKFKGQGGAGFDEDARKELDKLDAEFAASVARSKKFVFPLEEAKAFFEQSDAMAEQGKFILAQGALKQEELTKVLVSTYQLASKEHDAGAQDYIVDLLLSSDQMRQAFLTSADLTSSGFRHLKDRVLKSSHEMSDVFAGQLGALARNAASESARSLTPSINLNGGQKFVIQQEFREADPDRVIVAFQRGIAKAAVSRVQASTSTAFGT